VHTETVRRARWDARRTQSTIAWSVIAARAPGPPEIKSVSCRGGGSGSGATPRRVPLSVVIAPLVSMDAEEGLALGVRRVAG
jgi:hypothetical protein